MRYSKYYTLAQIVILLGLGALILFSGTGSAQSNSGCTPQGSGSGGCNAGSALPSTASTRQEVDLQVAGRLDMWYDYQVTGGTVPTKMLVALRSLAQTPLLFGVAVPTAPGASEPGKLAAGDPHIELRYTANNQAKNAKIALAPDINGAASLTALFPLSADRRWQALTSADQNWITLIPAQTTTFKNISGSLTYKLDFLGSSYCDGCEMNWTVCAKTTLNSVQRGALRQAGVSFIEGNDLICADLRSFFIEMHDNAGRLLPGRQPFASFGPAGGLLYTTTVTSSVRIPLRLEHNLSRSQTFKLEPVVSEQGWNYTWANARATPIAQIEVPVSPVPIWNPQPANLLLIGQGLPICAQIQDTIHVTATHVTTGTLRATTFVTALLAPNPSQCTILDLGVRQTASVPTVNGGQVVTFTTTISNYESSAVNAIVTHTLEPLAAIGALRLPPGCEQRRNEIICQAVGVPANGVQRIFIGVQTAADYGGDLNGYALVAPAVGLDQLYLDNLAGPVTVHITATVRKIVFPLILRLH